MNPPHFHLLVLPLLVLPPLGAVITWAMLNLAAFAASIRAVARELHIICTPTRLAWTVVATILCSATGTIIVTGQVTFLLLWPITLAWIAARRHGWSRAAAYLGVAVSIKPFLGVFWLYLLARRQFAAAATMAGVAMACTLVGLLVFGWTAYVEWVRVLSTVDWTWAPMNGSLMGIMARGLGDSPFFTPILHAPGSITPVSLILGIVAILLTIRILRDDRSRDSVDRAFAGLLLVALLASPLGWVYYVWLVVGPAVALWQSSRQRASRLAPPRRRRHGRTARVGVSARAYWRLRHGPVGGRDDRFDLQLEHGLSVGQRADRPSGRQGACTVRRRSVTPRLTASRSAGPFGRTPPSSVVKYHQVCWETLSWPTNDRSE